MIKLWLRFVILDFILLHIRAPDVLINKKVYKALSALLM
jgi:hypothetical protein